ncbi:MAG TPA: fumarylacetoacetate hydrolase family protein [Chloroflexota bacterium]|nr:fumarylacetoacetate hydrolase family protein [Chloroflexota bacterium]
MKIVTFTVAKGAERLGALTNEGIVDLAAVARASGKGGLETLADVLAFLKGGAATRVQVLELVAWARDRRDPTHLLAPDRIHLRAPVPRPPKILCLAGNYAEHWRESGHDAPPRANHTPEVFVKPVTTIVGPDAPIRLPGPICLAVDYEGELAVIIGRLARNVAPERALDYVAGYANFNDVSGRRLTIDTPREPTARTSWFDWLNGKWFDTFGPLGPFLVIDEVQDPQALAIQTRVNGAVRQNATTADMIFSVAETIAWISRFLTLEPGDLIATGTPSGVGSASGTFLREGDVVEVEVAGLGVLRNTVVAPADTAIGS